MSIVTALRPRHVAWLPAALLLAYLIAAASGMTTVADSRAASSGTTVTAEVEKEVSLNLTTCGAAGTITGPTDLTVSDGQRSLGSCELEFGSNNNGTGGATLAVRNTRGAAGNSFCDGTLATTDPCSGRTFVDVSENATAFNADHATTTTGKFGVAFEMDPGCTPILTAGDATSGARHALLHTDQNVCSTDSTSLSTVSLHFMVNPNTAQPAGSYAVGATLTATAD